MSDGLLDANAAFIGAETAWFKRVLDARLELHARGGSVALEARGVLNVEI